MTLDGAYAYTVRALGASGASSPHSAVDTATTVVVTDAAVVPGMTIKAVHITDLRRAAAALGAAAGLPAPAFTDPDLGRGTLVKAVQLEELAGYANAARQALGAAAMSFSSSTTVRAADVESVRSMTR